MMCLTRSYKTVYFALFLPESTTVIPIFQTNGQYVGIITGGAKNYIIINYQLCVTITVHLLYGEKFLLTHL